MPAKRLLFDQVSREALRNAASVAGLLVTAECAVAEAPRKKNHDPAADAGGDDY